MRILGIETSCDETSAAVVQETGDAAKPWTIRSNVIASQVPIHREWGGVVPELASRQHIRDICGVVERALDEAATSLGDLGAIAVTQGPGLVGSLLIGVSFAKAMAAASGLPLVAVHHLAGHIESLVLQNGEMPLPAVVLVVSGGHTSLYLVEQPGRYRLLSRTRDVAASFQRIVVTVLIERLFDAARRYEAKSVGIAGGVSANSRLRAELQARGAARELPTFLPSLQLSTDNAAMIAAAGLRQFRAGVTAPLDINADASLRL